MMQAFRLLLAIWLFGLPALAADLAVTFMPNGESRHFPEPQRLSTVLKAHPAAGALDTYWSGAFLGDRIRQYEVEAELRAVIAAQEVAFADEDELALTSIRQFLYQLRRTPMAYRPQLLLDPDLVRVQAELNPMLSGNYVLVVPTRPKTVTVLGLVEQPGQMAWQPFAEIASYLEQAKPLAAADDSLAWIIQPDGVVEQAPFAYWNKQPMGIAPGATIFIGLDGHDDLNLQTANLLRHRVPE